MPKSGTLTKAHIVEAVAEANGYTCNQFFEIVEILLERIKAALESGDDVLISSFGKFCVRKKKGAARQKPGHRKRSDYCTKKSGHIQMVRETERKTELKEGCGK